MSYEIKLDIFEGPLDLLLYLIKKNEIDIYNIPIALITEQYLNYLGVMQSLNLDLAGEYLVLASTLLHIKSKMLLPVDEEKTDEDEEGEDPREELVKQLVEYQAFKEVALKIEHRPVLERDVFKRTYPVTLDSSEEEEEPLEEIDMFVLLQAFQRIVASIDDKFMMDIDVEKMTLTDRINDIMERLTVEKSTTFSDLLSEHRTKKSMVYTFLAILELMKLKMIKVYQSAPFDTIRIRLAVEM
jgi:segregation and condensation protein A